MANANWSNPTLTSTYTNFVSEVKNRDEDLALQFDGTTSTNIPTNTIRWDSSANRWKKWSGTAWDELATTYALTGLSTTGSASIGTTLTVTGATTLTGGGTSTTPATDNNSTNIATTAFVVGQASATTPLINGAAAVGTSLRYARQDHIHPTDTTRAPLASPTFTGTVTIPAGASITGYLTTASAASTYAPLASPTLTGTPLAPTAANGTTTTQIATTAFVNNGFAQITGDTFTGNVIVQAASQPQLLLNSTAAGSWKSNIRFQNSGTTKYEIGVDTSAAGANNFYFYDAVAAVNRAAITSTGVFQFDSGYGSAAAAYGCRAWVNFDGTGTYSPNPSTSKIRADGNVSSITKNGTGDYTVNFTTAMPDANYSAVITTSRDGSAQGNAHNAPASETISSTAYRFVTYGYGTYTYGDHGINTVAIIR
jgi:hypothetical protein